MKLKIFGAFTFDPTTKTLAPLFSIDGDNFFVAIKTGKIANNGTAHF
jgi:hypothetical protein